MSDKLKISRRDFMNGVALSLTAGTSLSPLELLAMEGPYPPALTGLRGSHPGSIEVAHDVVWNGVKYPRPSRQTERTYDLVVVGGGISGLSAALFYRQRVGPDAKILILDNHDDFGGHAKRNEFIVDGQTLIGHGGSQTIEGPSHYSPVARQLLKDVGIFTDRFYEYYDQEYFAKRKLGSGIWFSNEAYGKDVLAPDVLGSYFDKPDPATIDATMDAYPISDESRLALSELLKGKRARLSDLSDAKKIELLSSISYRSFLLEHAGMPVEVADMLSDVQLGLWGTGGDVLSVLEAYESGFPGTQQLELSSIDNYRSEDDEPYIFHFPDGNAGVARSIVRQLLPDAVPGRTMEDLVTSRVIYDLLDDDASSVRVRLNSTCVDVRHASDEKTVDVTYVRNGDTSRVRGKHVVLACYNRMIPHICNEVPEKQAEAINYATKMPLVYIGIAVRNWQAMSNLGYRYIYVPQTRLMYRFMLDFPVSMGDYWYTQNPDEPAILHGTVVPTKLGLPAREQCVAGQRQLYEMSFDDFERGIVRQLDGSLSAGGFDVERDIAAITVNRWPHGYAWEYLQLSDPPEFDRDNGPHVDGRAQIGRISIANSDASAYAYANGAIDAADRAVNEQIG